MILFVEGLGSDVFLQMFMGVHFVNLFDLLMYCRFSVCNSQFYACFINICVCMLFLLGPITFSLCWDYF